MITDKQGNPYIDAVAVRRPSGHVLMDDVVIADTVQCVHCNAHFVVVKGSRRKRPWCANCGGWECGKAECYNCVAFEKKLDEYERGRLGVLV